MSNPLRRGSREVEDLARLKLMRPQFVAPQFVGVQGSQGTGEGDPIRMDLLLPGRRRVVQTPPTGLVGHLSQDLGHDLPYEEGSGAMHSGSYFSNLLSNELSYPSVYGPAVGMPEDTPTPDEAPPCHETGTQQHAPAVGKEKKKGKNFSVEEDNLLCSAWLNVCMDPINATDQTKSTYWNRIHDYFHEHKDFESDRSQGSLQNRWTGIQHDVNLFAGCLSKIEGRNQSGCTYDDKIASACAWFKKEDKTHRNFPYMHCWKILKDKPKWMERRKHMNTPKPPAKKQKTTANSSPAVAPLPTTDGNGDHGQATDVAPERPAGKKKEKEKLRRRSSMQTMELFVEKKKESDAHKELKKEERWKKTIEVLEERNRIERERVELKRVAEEERIMNIDMNTMSYKQQQYYEKRQDEILARRLNI